jgi:hypothetical protein
VEAYARQLVAKPASGRVLALAADPDYRGPDLLVIDGVQVAVRGCVSSLAAREVLVDLPADGFAILLTDREPGDLGDALVARLRRQRIEPLDTWATVPGLFSGNTLDAGLRRSLPWLPGVLFDLQPAAGYPTSATELVTRDHILGALTDVVLGLPPVELGLGALLERLSSIEVRARWAALDDEPRSAIAGWVGERAGAGARAALELAAAPSTAHVHILALGLMLDVLYGTPDTVAGVADARRGWETGYRLPRIDPAAAAQVGTAARIRLRLLTDTDPAAHQDAWADTREAFAVAACPWAIGLSPTHPDGYRARQSTAAAALAAALDDGPATLGALEAAVAELHRHDLAFHKVKADTDRWDMAVRLARWLRTGQGAPPSGLAQALARQVDVDGWVDRALADVWSGSLQPEVATVYPVLCERVLAVRRGHDREFADALADATTRDVLPEGVLAVEQVLAEVVAPVSREAPVLLIVVDGMSTSVAVAVAEGLNLLAWVEHVREAGGGGGRLPVLAALPTMTRFSRTSLLCGALREGTQVEEKRGFTALTGGPVFHKDDLRAPAGAAINPKVEAALASGDRVVAVVLNTVDDHLAKHDPDGTRWSVEKIQHLQVLLEVAGRQGRTVVLVSDHGHVVERGGRAEVRELADARWRPASTGPAGPDEVLLAGPRVLAGGGQIVAPWVEDLRYGRKSVGYHGGASAAEVTIPLLVFAPRDTDLSGAGWLPAAAQAPTWWVQPVVDDAPPPGHATRNTEAKARPPRARRTREPDVVGQALFSLDEVAVTPAAEAGVGDAAAAAGRGQSGGRHGAAIEELLTAPAYRRARVAAGRSAPPDEVVVQVLDLLLSSGGRAPVEAVAAIAGVPPGRGQMVMAGLRRLLNVEAYPVLALDADGRTVVLDEVLWRQQFGITRR